MSDIRDEDEGTSQHKQPTKGTLHGESGDLQQFTNDLNIDLRVCFLFKCIFPVIHHSQQRKKIRFLQGFWGKSAAFIKDFSCIVL